MSGNSGIPQRLGKYEIRGTLGKGAMGLVYDGWDPVIGRQVAIKTVRLDNADDEETAEGIARFKREAQAAGRLQHPNIVGVFDFAETDDIAYIVMEFVPGGSLKDVLDKKQPIGVTRVCKMMTEVLSALAFSHARGIVHRDIKPANIMLTAEGTVKLADFGIARIESSSMTSVGVIMGTPAYMAPEQFLGEPADARSDIYAAGATFFHLLTGTRPYEGNPTSIMQKVLNAEVPPMASERHASVPVALDAVIRKAMARKREDRFQDASQFATALLQALTAPVPPPPPPPVPQDDGESTMVMGAGGLGGGSFGGRAFDNGSSGDGSGLESLLPPGLGDPATNATAAKPGAVAAAPAKTPAPTAAAAKQGGNGALLAGIAAVVLLGGGAGAYFLTQGGKPAAPAETASATSPIAAPQALPSQATAPHTPALQTSPAQTPTGQTNPGQANPGQTGTGQTGTGQAGTGATPPAVTPVPPPPDPAAVAVAVNKVLAHAHCALAEAAPSGNGLLVTGTAAAGDDDSHARNLATAAAGGLPIEWNVKTFTAPFCDTLEALHPAYAAGQLSLTIADGKTDLHEGDHMKMAIGGMDFPAWVRVETLDSSGSNYHLYPTSKDAGVKPTPAKLLPAGATLQLGGAGQNQWEAGPPYGDTLLVAVGSSEQLLPAPRRNNEKMDSYLGDLKAAIAAAQAHGAKVAANVLLLELSAKP